MEIIMVLSILKEERCPNWVIEHSIAVCKKAMSISKNFDVDLDIVEKGSLLHDIGRCKTNNIDHGIIGSKIAMKYGFTEEVTNIIERHVGTGISKKEAIKLGLPEKDYIPKTLEEKIVSHSDNLVHGSEEVSLEFTMKKWEKKLDNPVPSIKKLKKLHSELVLPFE
jgi:uncharacterized protein